MPSEYQDISQTKWEVAYVDGERVMCLGHGPSGEMFSRMFPLADFDDDTQPFLRRGLPFWETTWRERDGGIVLRCTEIEIGEERPPTRAEIHDHVQDVIHGP